MALRQGSINSLRSAVPMKYKLFELFLSCSQDGPNKIIGIETILHNNYGLLTYIAEISADENQNK
jgi:hypothetical protein